MHLLVDVNDVSTLSCLIAHPRVVGCESSCRFGCSGPGTVSSLYCFVHCYCRRGVSNRFVLGDVLGSLREVTVGDGSMLVRIARCLQRLARENRVCGCLGHCVVKFRSGCCTTCSNVDSVGRTVHVTSKKHLAGARRRGTRRVP